MDIYAIFPSSDVLIVSNRLNKIIKGHQFQFPFD